ncbi:MAG: PAS domain-containing protein [Hyphomicrobiales bacterium]|nr:PAS domain-containing protein [Hyphomicrobiales bacterium]
MRLATTQGLFAHWDRLRGERAAPTRGDIDPAQLRNFLADVFMLDAQPWQEGRIRLAGTRLCELFGHELKGQRLPELWFERERGEVSRLLGAVTGGMHGLVASLTAETSQGRELDLEMLLLPVRPNASSQCGAIGSFAATALPPWFGRDAITSLSTRTIRMIEHGSRPRMPFGRFAARLEARREVRQHLVVIPGGKTA